MFFRASLFGAFGASKRWLGTNADGESLLRAGMLHCMRHTLGRPQRSSPLGHKRACFTTSLFVSHLTAVLGAAGSTRPLERIDFYKAGAMTGFVAAFTEGPIDFYKSQLQVRLRAWLTSLHVLWSQRRERLGMWVFS
jgi:solute carrier family 25 carnitine/acylcarnitine transporter 20/29